MELVSAEGVAPGAVGGGLSGSLRLAQLREAAAPQGPTPGIGECAVLAMHRED